MTVKRWRCAQCDKIIPESHFQEPKHRKVALRFEAGPDHDAFKPWHKAPWKHGAYFDCGPILEEEPTDHHLCIEYLVGRVI